MLYAQATRVACAVGVGASQHEVTSLQSSPTPSLSLAISRQIINAKINQSRDHRAQE